jgi:hypothetical protein
MRGTDELVARLAIKRRAKLGELSDSAFEELRRSVRANPTAFVDDEAEEAFSLLIDAIARYYERGRGDEYLDTEGYLAGQKRRLAKLEADCEAALAIDPSCVDAEVCRLIARDLDPDDKLDALMSLDAELDERLGMLEALGEDGGHGLGSGDRSALEGDLGVASATGADPWNDVFLRGRLRLRFAIALSCLESARYRMACEAGEDLLALSPGDPLGARRVCLLATARLEDEEAFEELCAPMAKGGDAWLHLGRTILLYKLGRMPAARRALIGYARLVQGGAFALLRPFLVDTYLPDRPATAPCSFDEAMQAVFEADPIICDIPDFPYWAESIPEVALAARTFAERAGFDW